MEANKMSDRLDEHFGDAVKTITIKQTRRQWFQEVILGCQARNEFKWFHSTDDSGGVEQFATSLEESSCCMRVCCTPCYEYEMPIKDDGSGDEIMRVHRPMACCVCCCKCCSHQKMEIASNGQALGDITEQVWCWVPRFLINDHEGKPIYKVHSPTCFMGQCVNCCYEGNPCGKGCCKASFHVFPADQEDTDNGAPQIGMIFKRPKSLAVEVFSNAQVFDVTFPEGATAEQKALIAGSSIFFNSNFFEEGG